MSIKKIYLAGEMNSDWRDKVISFVKKNFSNKIFNELEFIIPERVRGKHDWNVARRCVDQDIKQINDCDYFFLYLNRSDLLGSLVELFHAIIMKKKVMIVDDIIACGDFTEHLPKEDTLTKQQYNVIEIIGSSYLEDENQYDNTYYWFLKNYLQSQGNYNYIYHRFGCLCKGVKHFVEMHIYDGYIDEESDKCCNEKHNNNNCNLIKF